MDGTQAEPKTTLFTGSSKVAEKLAVDLKGRVKLEDAGFDWKILGPDVQNVSRYTTFSSDVSTVCFELNLGNLCCVSSFNGVYSK